VHRELLRNTVELATGICESVPQAVDDLRESPDAVWRAARKRGLEIFSAGTHPFARWYDQEVSEGERYATLIDRTQWWGRHMLLFGMRVPVGVDSVGKVLPILNGLLRWFAHLQALSASSPFWGGADTGYASNRALTRRCRPDLGILRAYISCAVLRALRPGVDRLIGVHVLDVALGHQPQRLRAVGSAALGERCDCGYLPGGAGPAGKAALLDDAQQAIDMDRIDAPPTESLVGQRQQASEYELGRWRFTQARPVQPCVHAGARRLMKVLGRGRE
jgi:hypothetical protein